MENTPWVTITWASKWIWREIVKNIPEDILLDLVWWRDENALFDFWESVWALVQPWDVFDRNSDAYSGFMESLSEVQIHNAAINIDNIEDPAEQVILANLQNNFLITKLEELKRLSINEPILFVLITSISSTFVDILWESKLKRSPYALMKNKQSWIIESYRRELTDSWVSVVDVQPWLTQTRMVEHLGENWLRLANMFWAKAAKESWNTNLVQQRVLTPQEVWKAVANLVDYYLNITAAWKEFKGFDQYQIVNQCDLDRLSIG